MFPGITSQSLTSETDTIMCTHSVIYIGHLSQLSWIRWLWADHFIFLLLVVEVLKLSPSVPQACQLHRHCKLIWSVSSRLASMVHFLWARDHTSSRGVGELLQWATENASSQITATGQSALLCDHLHHQQPGQQVSKPNNDIQVLLIELMNAVDHNLQ